MMPSRAYCAARHIKVIHPLQIEPVVRGSAKRAPNPQRRVSGYRSAAFDDRVDADRRHADRLG